MGRAFYLSSSEDTDLFSSLFYGGCGSPVLYNEGEIQMLKIYTIDHLILSIWLQSYLASSEGIC